MFSKQLFGLEKNGSYKVWSIKAMGDSLDADITISHGKENGRMTEKTERFNTGKQGRDAIGQAVFEAEARIKKQIDKGYRETKEELQDLPLLAMLASDYNKVGHRIKFPCYTSVKYDGVRCLASKHADHVYLRSRTGQDFDIPSLSEALSQVMHDGEVLDGEIYVKGYELQDILSAVKRTDPQKEIDRAFRKMSKDNSIENQDLYDNAVRIAYLRDNLEFHIFDIPMDGDFEERLAAMTEHRENRRSVPNIKYCEYVICDNDVTLKTVLHPKFVSDGYEGVMLRNLNGAYESGKRSADLQKYKTMLDSEFEIVDIVPDKQGDGVYVCKNDVNDLTFQVVMGSLPERKFALENKESIIGKYLTVAYQTRYKGTLLAQFPAGKAIRSGYVVNDEFIPQE